MTAAGVLNLEQFAHLTARVEAGGRRDHVLDEAEVSSERWADSQMFWLGKMAELAATGQHTLHQRYLERLAEHLQSEKDALREAPQQGEGDLPKAPAPRIAPLRGRARRDQPAPAAALPLAPQLAPGVLPQSPAPRAPAVPEPAARPASTPPAIAPAPAPAVAAAPVDLSQTTFLAESPMAAAALPFAETEARRPSSKPPPDDLALPFKRSDPPPAPESAVPETRPLPSSKPPPARPVTLPFQAPLQPRPPQPASSPPPPQEVAASAELLGSTLIASPEEVEAARAQVLPFAGGDKGTGPNPVPTGSPRPAPAPDLSEQLGSTLVVSPEAAAAARDEALPFAGSGDSPPPAVKSKSDDPLARTMMATSVQAAIRAIPTGSFAALTTTVRDQPVVPDLGTTLVNVETEAAVKAAALPFGQPSAKEASSPSEPPGSPDPPAVASEEPAAAVAPLTLKQLVWLQCAIEASPEREQQLLGMLGLTTKSKAYAERFWERQFERDPSQREAYAELLEAQRARRRR